MHSYKSLIQKFDVISFDMFDTAIYRKVIQPTDIFNVMRGNNFKNSRTTLERQARQTFSNKKEIHFNDIYKLLPDSDFLKNLELRVEKDFIHANKKIVEIMEYAKSIGKEVIVVSDMYLDKEFLESILKDLEIPYDKFYLSSEYNATKHSGELYAIVKKDYPSKTILHFDDRKDLCIKAESLGIQAVQVPLVREKKIIDHLRDKHDKVDYSLYGALIAQNSNEGFWHNIGYNYVGISTLALLNLVYSEKENFDEILFLARDAYLHHDMYNRIFKKDGDPKGTYFKTNRWLQRCYAMKEDTKIKDKEFQYLISYFNGLNIHDTKALAKYLRIEHKGENLLLKHTWSISNFSEKSSNINTFAEIHFKSIKKKCLEIKEQYEKYLEKFRNKKVAIVDIGWNGTCLEFFANAKINVCGAYLFSYLCDDNLFKDVYKQDKTRGNLWQYFSINVFENLYGANHGTYKDARIEVVPNLEPWGTTFEELECFTEDAKIEEIEFYNKRGQIFWGAENFIRDFKELQDKYKIKISNELLVDVYNRLFNNPTLEEAENLGSIVHYNGLEPTYVAKPSELALLNRSLLDIELANSTWRDGFVKILKDKYNIDIDKQAKESYNENIANIVNKFVEENKEKKVVCIGAGSFAKHLLENTSLKELNIVFLDNFRKEPLCGKPVLPLNVYMETSLNKLHNDVCIWTMVNTDKQLEEQFKLLKPIKIF